MNKHSTYFLALLAGLTTACSAHHNSKPKASQVVEAEKAAPAKPQKMRHRAEPEGVISVDIVSYNNQLHLLTGKNHQEQKTLWYQQSDNGGQSWSKASKILNDNNIAAKMVRGNDAQIAAQGNNIVVTWTKYDKEARFNAGPMLAARSIDGGQTWQYTDTPAAWKKGPHSYIDMTGDRQKLYTVWLDSRDGPSGVSASQGLRFAQSVDGGLSWQTDKTLDKLTCSCCWNTVKTDSSGNAFVLYRDKQPSDFSIGVVNDQTQWQRLNHVGAFNWQFDGCPHIGGSLDLQTKAGKQRLHAIVGTGYEKYLGVHYLYSDDAGKNWSATQQLGDETAIHSDIAAHDNGRVISVWDMMGEDGLAIFFAESQDQGNSWSAPKQLSKAGMRATHPRIVKTEKGFLAVWTENDGHHQTLATRRL